MRGNWQMPAVVLLILCGAVTGTAQSGWQPRPGGIGFNQRSEPQWVKMISPATIAVGAETRPDSQQTVKLQFAIDSGLHINSHTPRSHYLIPTTLTLETPRGVTITSIDYPHGVDYHFDFSPNDAVSVYTGIFAVSARLIAKPGRYTVHGQLHYQACNNRTCNSPKTLPVTFDLAAK